MTVNRTELKKKEVLNLQFVALEEKLVEKALG